MKSVVLFLLELVLHNNIIQIGPQSLFTQFLALRAHGEVGGCSAVHSASQSRMFDIDESQRIL